MLIIPQTRSRRTISKLPDGHRIPGIWEGPLNRLSAGDKLMVEPRRPREHPAHYGWDHSRHGFDILSIRERFLFATLILGGRVRRITHKEDSLVGMRERWKRIS